MPERYKREIEEILRQAGEVSSGGRGQRPRGGIPRVLWRQLIDSLGGKGWSITPGRVMLAAVCLLLSAAIVRAFAPGFVGLLFWAGLILFIVGYAMFFMRPKSMPKSIEKRWRGRPVEDREESWWQRLRRKVR